MFSVETGYRIRPKNVQPTRWPLQQNCEQVHNSPSDNYRYGKIQIDGLFDSKNAEVYSSGFIGMLDRFDGLGGAIITIKRNGGSGNF
jgi:hypothetical protein